MILEGASGVLPLPRSGRGRAGSAWNTDVRGWPRDRLIQEGLSKYGNSEDSGLGFLGVREESSFLWKRGNMTVNLVC